MFPFYLSIGMSYEQFWCQDCELVRYYRKAAQIRRELENQNAWLQGLYIYEAIADLAPALRAFGKKGAKAKPYRSEPIQLRPAQESGAEKQDREKRSDERARAIMEMFTVSFNAKFKAKSGDADGE